MLCRPEDLLAARTQRTRQASAAAGGELAGRAAFTADCRMTARWPLPLAPPPPQLVAQLCSAASQLLWQSLTSPNRASVTTAPRLPTTDRQPNRAFGRSGDLPVPVQGACVHARFSDHAGSSKCSRLALLDILPSTTQTVS